MTPFVRRFRVPLYGQTLYIAVADTLGAANEALPSSCDGLFDLDTLGCGAAAVTTTCEDYGIVAMLLMRRHSTAPIVAHEAIHATLGIMKTAGVGPMCDSNEEAYAYLLSWIVECAADVLRRVGRTNRKATKQKETDNV